MTNRNAAGVEPTMKRGVGSFGSQITQGSGPTRDLPSAINDFQNQSDFRMGINQRIGAGTTIGSSQDNGKDF
jgi:hypothetical protein